MNRIALCILLLVQYGVSFAQSSQDDSLLAHYPLHVGNVWDYRGGFWMFSGSYFYPRLTLLTAKRDSTHSNGQHYTVVDEIIYDMFGHLSPGTFGAIYRRTNLVRIDSTTLNVLQYDPWLTTESGGDLLIDSLRAQLNDLIFVNRGSDNILQLFEQGRDVLWGKSRTLRKLIVVNALVGYSFTTVEGIGEILWTSGGEGEPSYRDLQGAVIQGDTLGILVRAQSPKLILSATRLDFWRDRTTHTMYFNNPGLGLTIVDSVALAHDHLFTLQPSYNGATFGSGWFQKGPFLVFPSDSIRVDLALIPEDIPGQAFIDTFCVFAHGLNGERLPEIRIPLAFSPTVAVEKEDQSTPVPRQIALKIYPNPSNAQVTITFETKERGNTMIRVVDVLGREVAVLLNETKAAGTYRINWDAHELNTGIYFIELETAGERRVQNWLLLK